MYYLLYNSDPNYNDYLLVKHTRNTELVANNGDWTPHPPTTPYNFMLGYEDGVETPAFPIKWWDPTIEANACTDLQVIFSCATIAEYNNFIESHPELFI